MKLGAGPLYLKVQRDWVRFASRLYGKIPHMLAVAVGGVACRRRDFWIWNTKLIRPVNFAEPCYFLPHLGEGRGPDRLVTCVVFLFPPIFNAQMCQGSPRKMPWSEVIERNTMMIWVFVYSMKHVDYINLDKFLQRLNQVCWLLKTIVTAALPRLNRLFIFGNHKPRFGGFGVPLLKSTLVAPVSREFFPANFGDVV